MAKPEDRRRVWRNSKLPTRPAPTNISNDTTPKRVQVKHEATHSDRHNAGNKSPRPLFPRILTSCTPVTRPVRPDLPSRSEAHPPPSTLRKRGADPVYSAIAPAPKRPALKRSKSDFASTGVAVAWQGKKNEVLFSSLTGQEHAQPAVQMNDHASHVIKSTASKNRKQTFVWGMDPFQSKYEKNTSSTSEPVTAITTAAPRTKPMDASKQRIGCLLNIDFGPCAPGSACRGCGSPRHKTKDCHVPFNDGTAVICPFHDCSVLDKSVPHHPLDVLMTYHPNDTLKKKWSHCPLVMSYKQAVRANNRERMRYMLPQMFGELVLNRKRKPPIRVVNPELCFVNIAIEFSRAFCQGQMPSGLQGVWPYTMRDAAGPAILNKLQEYDKLGSKCMPPGELEAKSWDQIKREYAQGVIPAQISKPSKQHMKRYKSDLKKHAAAEAEAKEIDQRVPDVNLEPQSVEQDSDSRDSIQEGDTLPLQEENTALMDEVLRLSAKVDNMAETLNGLRGKQRGPEVKAEPGSRAQGTWSDPIDIDMDHGSTRWYVE